MHIPRLVASTIAPICALLFLLLALLASGMAQAQFFLNSPILVFDRAIQGNNCVTMAQFFTDDTYVAALLHLPDGGMIYSGRFDGVGTWLKNDHVPRNGIVRTKPDGSIDPDWHPDIGCHDGSQVASVTALATDSSGNVYVGGRFMTPGNDGWRNLARFNAKGELDIAWRMDTDHEVLALTVDENDDLFVGGEFKNIGGVDRPYLAKISQGKVVQEWKPSVDMPVRALLPDKGGVLYAGGGEYGFYTSRPDGLLVKLSRSGNGAADSNWHAQISGAPANRFSFVLVAALAMDGQGRVYAGGYFESVNGSRRNNIVRLAGLDGTVDEQWMAADDEGFPVIPNWDYYHPIPVQAIALGNDGEVFVGGKFFRPSGKYGMASLTAAKITAQGKFDQTWGQDSMLYGTVSALSTAGGRIYLGGNFSSHASYDAKLFLAGALPVTGVSLGQPVTGINLNQHGLSGSWGRSNTPGTRQGFLLNVYPDNFAPGHGTLFAGWYTYDVAGSSGGQRWYALQGDVYSSNTFAALSIYTATGGNLNSGSKPSNSQVGTAMLSFSDCSNGMLVYSFDDGRSGSIPLSRVTANTNCSTSGGAGNTAPANSLLSGAWGTPAATGMGFVIDISPSLNNLFGSWYTFFPAGIWAASPRQQWFVFQDNNFGPTATSSNDIDLLQSTGGTFDATVGDGVTTTAVGKVSLSFQSCTEATLTYSIPAQSMSQTTVPLVRLGPAPMGCHL